VLGKSTGQNINAPLHWDFETSIIRSKQSLTQGKRKCLRTPHLSQASELKEAATIRHDRPVVHNTSLTHQGAMLLRVKQEVTTEVYSVKKGKVMTGNSTEMTTHHCIGT
jgi:hypothetical protein